MAPMTDMLVSVPEGTTDHGTTNLICSPAEWIDYITFFAINYVVHAFTLMSLPGETIRETVLAGISALFVPGSGMIRSLRWIFSHASTESDPLQEALRAGAVCMVVKAKNVHPSTREDWAKKLFNDKEMRLVPVDRSIHGTCTWPEGGGYYLAEVPAGIQPLLVGTETVTEPKVRKSKRERILSLFPRRNSTQVKYSGVNLKNMELPRKWNFFKPLVGLAQTLYGCYTLYKAMGNQIDTYGMVAFGLTVAPYAFMSIMNSLSSLLTPEYPSMFLIQTPDMDAAVRASGSFGGAIAKLNITALQTYQEKVPLDFLNNGDAKTWTYRILLGILVLTPLAIIGGLSKFHLDTSHRALSRNVWVLSWLIMGSISTYWWREVHQRSIRAWGDKRQASGPWYKPAQNLYGWLFVYFSLIILLWVPAIGGMVQVGFMMRSYGSCVKLSFNPFG